ncbi:MAG: hypothetical protein GF387_00420 [Candidatus Portnoybacteria bacterium]|nr:hypothetical protein [Candidatus Portnoybacteria bacterium]
MDLIANTILNLLYQQRYLFSFIGAIFEGTYIMILGGVLLKLGYFKFWKLILTLGLGYFINGLIFYSIGRLGGKHLIDKWMNKFHITSKIIEKLENYFQKHSVKAIFITRITYGLSVPAIIIAGSFKMKMKKFIPVTLLATIVWVPTMLIIGYVFGLSYEAIGLASQRIAKGLAIIIGVVISLIFIFIIYKIKLWAQHKFVKKMENNRFRVVRKIGEFLNKITK